MKERLKFYVKRFVVATRAIFFFFVPVVANQDGCEDRILVVGLDLIGDMIAMTSVLRYYREAFPGKKIYLAINMTVHPALVGDLVDDIISVDTGALKKDPCYGYRLIKKIRRIGFALVIGQNPSLEFVERTFLTELGARHVFGYEGWRIDFDRPFNANVALGVSYFEKHLAGKFTKLIPRIEEPEHPRQLRHMIRHYAAIFESVTGTKKQTYVPILPELKESVGIVEKILKENKLEHNSYCVLSLATSSMRKDWPVERFIEVGKWLRAHGVSIVLVGGKNDILRASVFESALDADIVNLVGKTSILDIVPFIRDSRLTLSNDTSLTHIAVTLGKPSLSIMAMGHFGRMSLYGRSDINRWVYWADAPCRCDNMQCMMTVGPAEPAPCIAAIPVAQVISELRDLLGYLEKTGGVSKKEFVIEFSGKP